MRLFISRSFDRPDAQVQSAFTRCDLLATAATLGLLAMLTSASVGNNHSGSQSAVCSANLRDLTIAFSQYAIDNNRFPPNPDDGNTTPGYAWVPGNVGPGGAQQFNPDILRDPSRSLLFPYLRMQDAEVYRCPVDHRYGYYQGNDPNKRGTMTLVARSYSMNGAVGTDPYSYPYFELPTQGAWLDNNHGHVRGKTWRTYARWSDIVAPTPEKLAILLDEDEYSINDGVLSFGMQLPQWIDWPATRHQMGGTISFADGHVELRHWVDPSTQVANGNVARKDVPGSSDYQWLWERISARIQP